MELDAEWIRDALSPSGQQTSNNEIPVKDDVVSMKKFKAPLTTCEILIFCFYFM